MSGRLARFCELALAGGLSVAEAQERVRLTDEEIECLVMFASEILGNHNDGPLTQITAEVINLKLDVIDRRTGLMCVVLDQLLDAVHPGSPTDLVASEGEAVTTRLRRLRLVDPPDLPQPA